MTKLLSDTDPKPYSIFNEDVDNRVLVICDHASNTVPQNLNHLGLKPEDLEKHIAYDIGAKYMTERFCELMACKAYMSAYSRLVIDCNRQPNTIESIPSVSDEIPIPGNQSMKIQDIEQRYRECFIPYHNAIDMELQKYKDKKQVPAIISMHSYTHHFSAVTRPWHIAVLWDRDPRIAIPLLESLYKDPALDVGDNQPYSGKAEYGYSIENHAILNGFPHVLIEVKQDLIDTKEKAYDWGERLFNHLNPILDNDQIYKVERF